ncbi:hypothetical protein TNCV_1515091 [Trichonephila clavipes]|nr:hypothetical protein TNCV_1515091 [Trichonephila clavipes]
MLLLHKELESSSDSSILYLELSLAWCCDLADGSGRSFGCKDQWGGRGRLGEPSLPFQPWILPKQVESNGSSGR